MTKMEQYFIGLPISKYQDFETIIDRILCGPRMTDSDGTLKVLLQKKRAERNERRAKNTSVILSESCISQQRRVDFNRQLSGLIKKDLDQRLKQEQTSKRLTNSVS